MIGLFISTIFAGTADVVTLTWVSTETANSTRFVDIPQGKVAKLITAGGLATSPSTQGPREISVGSFGVIIDGKRVFHNTWVNGEYGIASAVNSDFVVVGPIRMYFVGGGGSAFVTLEVTDHKSPSSGITLKTD